MQLPRLCFLASLALIASSSGLHADEAAKVQAINFFETSIRPQLVAHCYECHSAGGEKQMASLSVDSRDGLLTGGDSGPAIVPGRPEESLLLKALRHDADVSAMPPSEKLPADVIANFEKWIRDGAIDPRDGTPQQRRRGMSLADGRQFWSFRPPHTPEVPAADSEWARGPIDHFIRAAQVKGGIRPLEDADPATLLRRLSFDLVGLPPTPEQAADFIARWDSRPEHDIAQQDAVLVETVDALLESPQFGERWGRHWLDVVRYADSNGRDRNVYFYHAWRYRDYVINAYNGDKPFDAFIREQIAGDLLPAESNEQRDSQRIATAFLALGSKAFEEQKPEVFRMDVIDDQIEVIGRAFLGLSIGCARCHDHKFDPIATADYYALAGIFRSTQPLYGYGPKGIRANVHTHTELIPVGPDAEALGPGGLEYLKQLQELTLAQNESRSKRYRVVRNLNDARLRIKQPGADAAALEADIARMESEIAEWDQTVKAAEAALQAAMDAAPPQPGWTMGVRDRETPEDCRIHIRGETTTLGGLVPRGMPQVVELSQAFRPTSNGSGRVELANWLTHRDHPLTARVYVNRVWQHLFGRGLVTTPDDYGINGARPSHPELLDYLAVRFMDEGWSTKRLIRAVVLSRVYRMSGEVRPTNRTLFAEQMAKDPDNVLLWRRVPRRIEAEILHDSLRSVAGTLYLNPPAAENAFLAQYNPYREDEYRTFKPLFGADDLQHRHRAVYLPVVRGVLPEIFQLFDFAPPERSVSERAESLVPAQALYFLNSPWIAEQAEAFARRLLEIPNVASGERVERMYRFAFGRPPISEERERALQYLEADVSAEKGERPDPLPRWTNLCQVIFASAEFRYVK